MTGWVQYESEDDFRNVIVRLQEGGWMNEELQLIDELRYVHGADPKLSHVDVSLRLIRIPWSHYRNLSFSHFLGSRARDARRFLAATCTDGDRWASLTSKHSGAEPYWLEGLGNHHGWDLSVFADEEDDLKSMEAGDPEEYSAAVEAASANFFYEFQTPTEPTTPFEPKSP
jgi:hypothetical protein